MTIQTLRPNGLDTQSGFGGNDGCVISGGASIWGVLSDNSDSSWLRGNIRNGWTIVQWTDLTPLSPGQRVLSTQMRARTARMSSSGGLEQMTFTYLDTVSRQTALPWWILQRGSMPIATSIGPLQYNSSVKGQAWSEQLVNQLAMKIGTPVATDLSANYLQLYELYLDCDIRSQPVVTGTPTVTGFLDNARPTIGWVYSDADNVPQAAWEVKIFDSNTYGNSGFNADTSTPMADSGVIKSVDSQWTSTVDLQNGVTYEAYVKVAIPWAPVNNTSGFWWSAWVPSGAFTVSSIPPQQPTLTITSLYDQTANYLNLVTANTPLNLLFGDTSSFENNSVGTWTATSLCTIAVTGTDGAHGTHSLMLTATGAGTMIAHTGFDLVGDPSVKGGAQYTAVCSFKAVTLTRSCNVGIQWIDKNGALISTSTGANITDSTSAWTQAFVTATAPGNAVQASVVVGAAAGGVGEIHKIDAIDLHAGSVVTFVPGFYLNSNPGIIIERGERCDNRRGPAENWAHPQVGSAGSVTQNSGYGFQIDLNKDFLYWEPLNKSIANRGNFPLGMLHWMPRATPGNVSPMKIGTWYYSPEGEWNFPVIGAVSHVGSLWAWTGAGTFVSTMKIEWLDQNSQLLSTTTFSPITLTTTPQQITLTAVGPGGACTQARIVMGNDNASNTADVYITRIGWAQGTVAVDHKPPRGGPLMWTQLRFPQPTPLPGFPPGFGQLGQNTLTFDYELPPGRPLVYRARMSTISAQSSAQVTSPSSVYQPVYSAPPQAAILLDPFDPDTSILVNRRHQSALTGRQAMLHQWPEDANVFHGLGRDGDPVKVRDWIAAEDGELLALTNNEAQAERLRALMLHSGILLIQWAQGGQTYCTITNRAMTEELHYFGYCDVDGGIPTADPYLRYDLWTLTYLETARP